MPETPTPFVRQLVAALARRTPGLDGTPPTAPAMRLRPEDRPDFEHVLDQALAGAPPPEPLTTDQVRTMALGASAAITATAAAEYAEYVGAREASPSSPVEEVTPPSAEEAGALAVVMVLVPVLSGAAALIFLATGYVLRITDAQTSPARHLTDAGWIFLALTALAFVAGAVGLLLTALRSPAPSVATARAAWHTALLEHGIRPFLHEVYQAQAATEPDGQAPPGPDTG